MQAVPRLEHEPLEQTAPLQVKVPQHCDDDEHEPPEAVQALTPVQTPAEQLMLPQQSALCEQRVPDDWQEPPLQTLLPLQVSTPQQSPLVLQTWLADWQDPVWSPPGMLFTSTPLGQPQSAKAEASRTDQPRTRGNGGMAIV